MAIRIDKVFTFVKKHGKCPYVFIQALIFSAASRIKRIITIEENVLAGGFGSAILEYLNSVDIHDVKIKTLGIPDEFVEQGSQAILRKKYGIDEEGIYQTCKAFLSTLTSVI